MLFEVLWPIDAAQEANQQRQYRVPQSLERRSHALEYLAYVFKDAMQNQ